MCSCSGVFILSTNENVLVNIDTEQIQNSKKLLEIKN